MAKFLETGTFADLTQFGNEVYTITDDRLFSIFDLLVNQERFTMRALKGIRKNDLQKLKLNLLIGFSWAIELANRLHIDIEQKVWQRFPYLCSYCGHCPCVCKSSKQQERAELTNNQALRPKNLAEYQQMFAKIYPPEGRTLSDAGVHLAEETGELAEAVQIFLGEHKANQFKDIENELADYISCVFGVANSAKFDVSKGLAEMFYDNCHVCHKAPCECNFSFVAKFVS